MTLTLLKNKYLIAQNEKLSGGAKALALKVLYKNKILYLFRWDWRTYLALYDVLPAIAIAPPIKYDYIKSPFVPMGHQKQTTNFLIYHPKAFCWNDAGTGKTASCIWAYDYLRQQKILKRLLIICPLSTTENVWGTELFNLLTAIKFGVLIGSKQKRLELLSKNYDIYIINHDGIKVLTKELKKWKPELIIIDEHTAFKAPRTERLRALRHIAKETKSIWALSGTPTPQAPTDVFAPARFICPDSVGRSFVQFRDRVMNQVSQYKWEPKSNFEEILYDIIKPVIRFARKNCLDLPDIVFQNYKVALSPVQEVTFKKLRKEAIILLVKGEIKAVNEGVMRNKLLQICSGYVYDTEKNVIDLRPIKRLEAVKEIIEESQRGILIFAAFRSSIAHLKAHLQKEYTLKVITGETSAKKRNVYFRDFQEGKIKILIAHPKTMAHGVTLTYADTVIWHCVTSDNELYEQANSRIRRIGQKNKMRVIHLLSTSLEQKILARLEQKRSTQGVLLDYLTEEV
jgi:SNF2 family DNA or RNA helicase